MGLGTGMISYWDFGSSGTWLNDSRGANTLQASGAAYDGDGLIGGCALFNAQNDSCHISDSLQQQLDFQSDFSIQAWVKRGAVGQSALLFSKKGATLPEQTLSTYISSTSSDDPVDIGGGQFGTIGGMVSDGPIAYIDMQNVANADGTLTGLSLNVGSSGWLPDIRPFTCYNTGGNTFILRDVAMFDIVADTGIQDYDIQLYVQSGDYLGYWTTEVQINYASTASPQYYYLNSPGHPFPDRQYNMNVTSYNRRLLMAASGIARYDYVDVGGGVKDNIQDGSDVPTYAYIDCVNKANTDGTITGLDVQIVTVGDGVLHAFTCCETAPSGFTVRSCDSFTVTQTGLQSFETNMHVQSGDCIGFWTNTLQVGRALTAQHWYYYQDTVTTPSVGHEYSCIFGPEYRRLMISGSGMASGVNGNGGLVYFETISGSGSHSLACNTEIADTASWHHVVMTYRQSTKEKCIYIDGVLDSSATADHDATLNNSAADVILGAFDDNTPLHRMDEVAVWGRVLGAYEVQKLYNNGNGLNFGSSIRSGAGLALFI